MKHIKSCVVPVQVNCAYLISLVKSQGSECLDFTIVERVLFHPDTSSCFLMLWTQTVWEPGGPCTSSFIFTKCKLFLQVLNTSLNSWTWWRIRICILRLWSCTPLALRSTRCVSSWQCSFIFPYSCVWISSVHCMRAGVKLQLLVFGFCRSLLFQCCLRLFSEITAAVTLSTNPADLVINGCYSFHPVTQHLEVLFLLLHCIVVGWITPISSERLLPLLTSVWLADCVGTISYA